MSDRISVRLTGPAKIEGQWRKPGEDVSVTVELARQLDAAGVIAEDHALAAEEIASGVPGFDEAVAAAARDIANAEIEAAVVAAMGEFEDEKNALIARAVEAEAQRDLLADRVLELQAQIPDADQAGNTEGGETGAAAGQPAAETAVKNARKGAAAKKG